MNKLEETLKTLDKAVVTDVRVYDIKEHNPFYDYAVIASVNSSRQGHAAIEYLKDTANLQGGNFRVCPMDDSTTWFLFDFEDIIVHIFVGSDREKYNLDGIYQEI